MPTRSGDKEIYDPFAHYVRGVLHYEDHNYSFTAYRLPYLELNEKTWSTEKAFKADYRRMVIRKYHFDLSQ